MWERTCKEKESIAWLSKRGITVKVIYYKNSHGWNLKINDKIGTPIVSRKYKTKQDAIIGAKSYMNKNI